MALLREYETIYILKSDLPPDQLDSLKSKFNETITKSEGHVLSLSDWGKRKLAYEVQKQKYAHYIYLRYLGDSELVKGLERLLRLDDKVLKFLTVKLNEHVESETRLAEKVQGLEAPEEYRAPEMSGGRRGPGRGFSSGGDRRRPERRAQETESEQKEAPESEVVKKEEENEQS